MAYIHTSFYTKYILCRSEDKETVKHTPLATPSASIQNIIIKATARDEYEIRKISFESCLEILGTGFEFLVVFLLFTFLE